MLKNGNLKISNMANDLNWNRGKNSVHCCLFSELCHTIFIRSSVSFLINLSIGLRDGWLKWDDLHCSPYMKLLTRLTLYKRQFHFEIKKYCPTVNCRNIFFFFFETEDIKKNFNNYQIRPFRILVCHIQNYNYFNIILNHSITWGQKN